ncbi:Metallo-dependent phosphatase [Trametes cingulata]|nr:Metallo-dependent phosphatase [Trametes cingulata]
MGPRKIPGLGERIARQISVLRAGVSQTSMRPPVLSIPTRWEEFCSSPKQFIARMAYRLYASLLYQQKTYRPDVPTIRIVCISDTHGLHSRLPPLPDGDILVHAGDLTNSGTEKEVRRALDWLRTTRFQHKIFIAGNHDRALHRPEWREPILADYPDLIYLQDSSATLKIRGHDFIVYGTPRTPYYRRSHPFSYKRNNHPEHWITSIPKALDILVTHSPPMGHLDIAGLGCKHLAKRLWSARPRIHVFGHLHGGRGVARADYGPRQDSYELVCLQGKGWSHVLELLYGTFLLRTGLEKAGRSKHGTTLVNAAVMSTEPNQWKRREQLLDAIVVELPLVRPKPFQPRRRHDGNRSSVVVSQDGESGK